MVEPSPTSKEKCAKKLFSEVLLKMIIGEQYGQRDITVLSSRRPFIQGSFRHGFEVILGQERQTLENGV